MRRIHAIFGFAFIAGLVITVLAMLTAFAMANETTDQGKLVLHVDGYMVREADCVSRRIMTTLDCMSEPKGGPLCDREGKPRERALCADPGMRPVDGEPE